MWRGQAGGSRRVRRHAFLLTVLVVLAGGGGCGKAVPNQNRGASSVGEALHWDTGRAEREMVRLFKDGQFVSPGRPLRVQFPTMGPEGDAKFAPVSAAVGAGTLTLQVVKLPDGETLFQQFGVTMTLRIGDVKVSRMFQFDEILLQYRLGGGFERGGRAYRLVELIGSSSGSGVYYRVTGVLVSFPGEGRSGQPAFEGWLPLASYVQCGAGEWTTESSELFVDDDGQLSCLCLLQWETDDSGAMLRWAPWRTTMTSPLEPVRREPPECAGFNAADRSGLAGVIANRLVERIGGIEPGAGGPVPWSLREAPGVRTVAMGSWPGQKGNAQRDVIEVTEPFLANVRRCERSLPAPCLWVARGF